MFVVSLPFAVASGGYWALLAMLLVAYVCCYTGKILIDCLYDDDNDEVVDIFNGRLAPITMSKCKRRHRVRVSYVDIAKDVWGSFLGARIVNIAQNIEPRKQRGLLKHHHPITPRSIDRDAVGGDLARIRQIQSGHEIEQRGFPAATGTDQAHELSFAYVERNIIERMHRALAGNEAFAHAPDRQFGRRSLDGNLIREAHGLPPNIRSSGIA